MHGTVFAADVKAACAAAATACPPRHTHAPTHITHNNVPAACWSLMILSNWQAVRMETLHCVSLRHVCIMTCTCTVPCGTAPNSELCDAGSEHCVPLSVPLCVNLMGRACSALSLAGLLLLKWNEIFCDLIWFKYIFCLCHFVNHASLHCGFCSWCSVWPMAIDQLFIKTHKQLVFRWKSIIRYKYCRLCNYCSFTSDIFEEIRRNLAIKRTSYRSARANHFFSCQPLLNGVAVPGTESFPSRELLLQF